MKYNRLPTTDIEVSEICLGTMTWGEQNSEEQAHEQMSYALDQGVNFFDTAELYAVPPSEETQGLTEKYIGTWFQTTGQRDKAILATKVTGPGMAWIRKGQPITPDTIKVALEGSLERLQTDYIDLYQIHWPNREVYQFTNHFSYAQWTTPRIDGQKEKDEILAILQALDGFIKEGKIRHVGLSNETAWGTIQYLQLAKEHDLPRMITIQNEYSLLCRIFDWDLAEVCAKEAVGLLAWSPLATGILSGKYLDGTPPGTRHAIRPSLPFRRTEKTNEATRAYIEIAEKHGLDVCQMAIAFTLRHPHLTSSIIGATTMEQLKTNIAASGIKLSEEVLQDINGVWKNYPMPY